MNHTDYERLNRRLREGDPAEEQNPLEIAAMRRRLLEAAGRSTSPVARWQMLATVGALILLCVVALTAVPGWLSRSGEPRGARSARNRTVPAMPEARQVQFQTPGGTRVIWVVASNLDL